MVDESGVVPSIHGVDTDVVVKRVCVFPSRVIAEESSRGTSGNRVNRGRIMWILTAC